MGCCVVLVLSKGKVLFDRVDMGIIIDCFRFFFIFIELFCYIFFVEFNLYIIKFFRGMFRLYFGM